MQRDDHEQRPGNAPRATSRLIDSIPETGRRRFLQIAVAHGIAAPIALASLGSAKAATPGAGDPLQSAPGRMGVTRTGLIVRDFADPYLELIRLLREASEIEHGLMLQYLYCASSIKERYQPLVGQGAPTATNVLGVAVQEMQHLRAVNHLLVALGSGPNLQRQDFPYEPDIYPFPFGLEPLSRGALAKYVYCEGPGAMFAADGQRTPEDERFRQQILGDIGRLDRPNHVGSLYQHVLELLAEAAARPGFPLTPAETEQWRNDLTQVMHEGEHDHFEFFRQVYEGRHPAFASAGVPNVWDLPMDHAAYPALPVPKNPTAYVGHPSQIESEDALALGWLSNLHYWVSLACLDYSYRYADQDARSLSLSQMTTALWPLALELPKHGAGVPFDPLSMGYALGAGKEQSRRLILAFAKEAQSYARSIESLLPARYNQNNVDMVIKLLDA